MPPAECRCARRYRTYGLPLAVGVRPDLPLSPASPQPTSFLILACRSYRGAGGGPTLEGQGTCRSFYLSLAYGK